MWNILVGDKSWHIKCLDVNYTTSQLRKLDPEVWRVISTSYMDIDFAEEFQREIDWNVVAEQDLDEMFIRKFITHFDLRNISYRYISERFVREFINELDRERVMQLPYANRLSDLTTIVDPAIGQIELMIDSTLKLPLPDVPTYATAPAIGGTVSAIGKPSMWGGAIAPVAVPSMDGGVVPAVEKSSLTNVDISHSGLREMATTISSGTDVGVSGSYTAGATACATGGYAITWGHVGGLGCHGVSAKPKTPTKSTKADLVKFATEAAKVFSEKELALRDALGETPKIIDINQEQVPIDWVAQDPNNNRALFYFSNNELKDRNSGNVCDISNYNPMPQTNLSLKHRYDTSTKYYKYRNLISNKYMETPYTHHNVPGAPQFRQFVDPITERSGSCKFIPTDTNLWKVDTYWIPENDLKRDISILIKQNYVPLEMIEYYLPHVNFHFISNSQFLSEEFILKYGARLYWAHVRTELYTPAIIKKYINRVNLKEVILREDLNEIMRPSLIISSGAQIGKHYTTIIKEFMAECDVMIFDYLEKRDELLQQTLLEKEVSNRTRGYVNPEGKFGGESFSYNEEYAKQLMGGDSDEEGEDFITVITNRKKAMGVPMDASINRKEEYAKKV